jgi:hypothetical protein
MTESEIRSKLSPALTGARILKDRDYGIYTSCDHILGVNSRGVLTIFPAIMAKYGGIGFTFCPICGVKLDGV